MINIREFINRNKNTKEIKYFSTDGSNKLPNGVYIQKGMYITECTKNKENFNEYNNQYLISNDLELVEAIHKNQYSLSEYKGGIIVFSVDVNSVNISKNKLVNWFKKKIKSYKNKIFSKKQLTDIIRKFNSDKDKTIDKEAINDKIGAFSIGNFFLGRYIDDAGNLFDEKSMSLEINGITSNALIYLAEEIAKNFEQETVLVKDLNKNKIYLVDSDKSGSYKIWW